MQQTRQRRRWQRLVLSAACGLGLVAGCQDENAFSTATAYWTLSRQARPQVASRAVCEDPPNAEAVASEMLAGVNAERSRAGVPPLRLDPTLTRLAGFYACRMVEDGFFAHEDPFDGSTVDVRAANFGYAFLKIGENLAAGQRSVDEALRDWMASPEHRANILDPTYTDIGIALKLGGECGAYWVQEFGRPLAASQGPVSGDRAAPSDAAAPSSQPAAEDSVPSPMT